MRVRLRQLKNKNGEIALRLDTFLGYYTDASGNRKAQRIRETLPLHIAPEDAKRTEIRQSILQQAEQIRIEKERELKETGLYPFFEKRKSHTPLLTYLDTYIEKHEAHNTNLALWKGLQKRLNTMCTVETQFKDINDAFCEQLISSLIHGNSDCQLKPLAPNSVKNYYSKFLKLLRHAKSEGYLDKTPNIHPKFKDAGKNKVFLTEDELMVLSTAFCSNQDLKNSFLFAVATGLHYSEIQILKWKQIKREENSWKLVLPDRANLHTNAIVLNSDAIEYLGPPGPNPKLVFPRLKSMHENNIQLLKWAVKANVGKQITFTISRNTFAALGLNKNLSLTEINIGLGHKDLKTTQKFLSDLNINSSQMPSSEGLKFCDTTKKFHPNKSMLSRAIRIQLRNYNYMFTQIQEPQIHASNN